MPRYFLHVLQLTLQFMEGRLGVGVAFFLRAGGGDWRRSGGDGHGWLRDGGGIVFSVLQSKVGVGFERDVGREAVMLLEGRKFADAMRLACWRRAMAS